MPRWKSPCRTAVRSLDWNIRKFTYKNRAQAGREINLGVATTREEDYLVT